MKFCGNVSDVIAEINSARADCIGIDGLDGVGKTTLAKEVARALDVPCISLDSFLEKNNGGYVEYIDYTRLESCFAALNGGGYVVEGVCLLQVLQNIKCVPSLNVYVQRIRNGVWADQGELDIQEPVSVVLSRLRAQASLFSSAPVISLGLAEEVIEYHAVFRPHDSANVLFGVTHL